MDNEEYVPLWYFNGYKGWRISDECVIDFMGTVHKELFKKMLDGTLCAPLIPEPDYLSVKTPAIQLQRRMRWERDNLEYRNSCTSKTTKFLPNWETTEIISPDFDYFNNIMPNEQITKSEEYDTWIRQIIKESIDNNTIQKDNMLEEEFLEKYDSTTLYN